MIRRPLAAALSLLSLVACAPEPPAQAPASPTAPTPPVAPRVTGDAEVLKVVTALQECPWEKGRIDPACGAWQSWRQVTKLRANELGVSETLTRLAASPTPRQRWAAATTLARHGGPFQKDRALAMKLIEAANAETDARNHHAHGSAIARINVTATGTKDALVKTMRTHPSVTLRASLARHVLGENPDLFDAVESLSRETSAPLIRLQAGAALMNATDPKRRAKACTLWLDHTRSESAQLSAESAYLIARDDACKVHWDATLQDLRARALAGTAGRSSTLPTLYKQPQATPSQRTLILEIARALVATSTNKLGARLEALEFLGGVDPERARAFLQDPDPQLQNKARAILARNKKGR